MNSTIKIRGLYPTIKNTYKAILISGLNIDDVLYRDAFGFVSKDEDNFNIICGEFVIAINNNDNVSVTQYAPSSNVPQAYTVSSIDELPNDAVDSSTAIVPNDSLIGTWEWKDNQSPLDLSMFNFPNDLTYDERVAINGYDSFLGVFNDISFSKVDSFIIKFGNTNLYVDDAFDDSYTTFSLYTDILYIIGDDITEENFKEFIKTNCNRLSGGYSLYTRENGEWIYKGEIVKKEELK